MSNTSYGNKVHNMLVANSINKKSLWGELLQTNEKGLVVNAQGALKYDDFKELTEDVVKVREYEFVGNFYRTMTSMPGMVRNMPIGKTLIDYKDMSRTGEATVSMDMANREAEQTNYDQKLVPLPIFHKDFVIPWRQEGFSYKQSDGVADTQFRVMETRDKVMIFGDSSIKVNGEELYGYATHPSTIKETGIPDFANPTNATDAYNFVVDRTKQLFLDSKVGAPNSLQVFVANDVYASLQYKSSDTKSNDLTIEQDIMRISQIRGVMPHQDLPDGAWLFVEMAPRTSDIAVASDVVATPWQRMNPYEDLRFTIMAAATPRIKTDRNGVTGILYATK